MVGSSQPDTAARKRKPMYLTARYRRCACGAPAMFLSKLCRACFRKAYDRGR